MEESREETGRRIDLPPAYVDLRGRIQNLLTEPCGGVAVIESKAGTERSNHYHLTDAHWLYVVSGKMIYQERGIDDPVFMTEEQTYGPGEMVYTPPMRWHRTKFPVDTVLISMSKRPRDAASHEKDVVRA